MEAKKNLCAMIPAELHNRLRQEQEQLWIACISLSAPDV